MGAKQSKRSVDITTTPKKGEGEVAAEGEGKVEQIPEVDLKITTNGAIHTEIEYADKEEESSKEDEPAAAAEQQQSDVIENGVSSPEGDAKTPEGGDQELNDSDKSAPSAGEEANENKAETPASETKKSKDKSKKKKWSFRSISFSKKDKSKPAKESDKNGDVKEVVEENAEAPIASIEETSKADEPASPAPVENGVASEQSLETVEEVPKAQVEEVKSVVEAEKVEEPAAPEPVKVPEAVVTAPSPVKEPEPKPPVEEPPVAVAVATNIEELPSVEEIKEVGSTEEIPPPLPASNPPNPVAAFAESTKAETPEPIEEEEIVQKSEETNVQQATVVEETLTEPIAADSLPDISTESLPSLPEPTSESLPEPMSLPPVENVPEPIAAPQEENLPPAPPSPVQEVPSQNDVVLTNGNTNGLPSPVANDDVTLPPSEGPLKQVVAESSSDLKCGLNNSNDATPAESTADSVQE